MKTNVYKKLLYIVCGVMAMSPVLTSCALEPYEIPPEEMYLRNFIMKYGLINDTQDWNMSTASEVTVIPSGPVKELNVMVQCGGQTYRVAEYADVDKTERIPIDIPDGTDVVYVEADGVQYVTVPNGTVTLAPASRAIDADQGWIREAAPKNTYTLPYWDSVNEKYIDLIKYAWTPDHSKMRIGDWDHTERVYESWLPYDFSQIENVTDQEGNTVYEDEAQTTPKTEERHYKYVYKSNDNSYQYRVGSTLDEGMLVISMHNYNKQKYTLSFRTAHAAGTADLQVYLVNRGGEQFIASEVQVENTGSWGVENGNTYTTHAFVTPVLPEGDYQLIVTASNPQGSNYAGNWGYFNMEPYEYQNMAWLMVAEDLGATDDFDFNDIIIRVECQTVNANIMNSQWQVLPDDSQHPVLTSRADPQVPESSFKRLRVTGLCAGGTLPLFLHFYDTSLKKDYIIGPKAGNVKNEAALDATGFDECEWHHWFLNDANYDYRKMINTGINVDNNIPTYEPEEFHTVQFYVGADFKMSEYSKFVHYDTAFAPTSNDPETWVDGSWDWPATPTDYYVQGFYITVNGPSIGKCKTAVYAPRPGAAPHMFLIPDVGAHGKGFEWPTERTNITWVYGDFKDWAKAGGNSTDPVVNSWYLHQNGKKPNSTSGPVAEHDYCPREIFTENFQGQ